MTATEKGSRNNGFAIPVCGEDAGSGDVLGEEGEIFSPCSTALFTDREEKLRRRLEEEERLELVLKGTRAGIWDWNVQTGHLVVNERWAEICGYSLAELAPIDISTWKKLSHPEDFRRSGELLERHFSGELPHYECECRMRRKNGGWVWVMDRGVVFSRTDQGEPLRMVGSHADISHLKDAETKLENSRRNFETFFNTIGDFLFVLDEEGRMLHVNRTVTERLGYSEEELLNESVLAVHPPERRDEAGRIVQAMLSGEAEYCPVPLLRKDGTLIPVETRITLGQWDGQSALFGVSKDISDLKRSEEKFSRAFEDNAALMAISTSREGRFVDVNRMFLETTGYSRQEVVGHTSAELGLFVNVAEREAIRRIVEEFGQLRNIETKIRMKNGDFRRGLFSVSRLENQDEPCWLAVMIDITERKNAEERLRELSRVQNRLMLLATDFVNVPSSKRNEAVDQALATMGELIDADRAYLFKYEFGRGTMSNTHEWCGERVSPEIDNLKEVPMDLFPEWVATHRRGELVHIPDVHELPGKSSLREILEPQGIRSLISLPLMHVGKCLGFVGFDAVRYKRAWREEEIKLLRVLAEVFSNFESKRAAERDIERLIAEQTMLLDTMDAQVWYLTDVGVYGMVNRAHAEFLGMRREEIENKRLEEFLTREVAAVCRESNRVVFSEKKTVHTREVLINPAGQERVLSISKAPKLGKDGEVEYVVCVAHDITELESIREALSASENRYRGLVESQRDLIVRVDLEGRFTYANDAYCQFFDKSRNELIGNTFQPLVHEEDLPETLKKMEDLFEKPYRIYVEQRAMTERGWRWLAWEDYGIRDENGNIVEIQGVGRDITKAKELNYRLIRAKKDAEQAAKAKSVFLANMSHEIRTPLNAILGYAQIMNRQCGSCPRKKRGLDAIAKSGEHLLDLINDILELIRSDERQVILHPVGFDLREILEDMRLIFSGRSDACDLTIEIVCSRRVPRYVSADKGKIRQVLMNLLGNAVKFTREGGIRIRADAVPKPSMDAYTVMVDVEDDGIGISEDQLERIFDPFEQTEEGQKTGKGTGLGLPLSRRYARALGGDVVAMRGKERGSIFRFTFNAGRIASGAVERKQPAIRRLAGTEGKRTVLIVDDEKSNRDMAAALLQEAGFDTSTVETGLRALELVGKGESFDVVLMDRQMPGMDGVETIRRMREFPAGKDVPVLIVSASGFGDSRDKALAEGAQGFVGKPVGRSRLLCEIRRVAGVEYELEETSAGGERVRREENGERGPGKIPDLSEPVRGDLDRALGRGDIQAMRRTVAAIGKDDPSTAAVLSVLVETYDYDRLRRLLDSMSERNAQA